MYDHNHPSSYPQGSPLSERRDSVLSTDSHNPYPQRGPIDTHNPYPRPSSAAREGAPVPGRPMSAVLAALASSDLEYSGIMRPMNDGGYDENAPGQSYRPRLSDPGSNGSKLTPSYDAVDRRPSVSDSRLSNPSLSPTSVSRSPWEQGYRDQLSFSPVNSVQPKKEEPDMSEPPKKRRRKAQSSTAEVPEGAEVEYEVPDDPCAGHVFIHPPKGAVQACVRCHRIKRKCDGAWPRCASCSRADVHCVFELSAATSSYVHKLKSTNSNLSAELAAARDRLQALEQQMSQIPRREETIPLSVPLPMTIKEKPAIDVAQLATVAMAMRDHCGSADSRGRRTMSPPVSLTDLLTHEQALQALEAYLTFNQIGYPHLDRKELPIWVHELYGLAPDGVSPLNRNAPRGTPSSVAEGSEEERRKFIILMVLALGVNGSERAGDGSPGKSQNIYHAAQRYRARALDREDLTAVQALVLLGIWTAANPSAGSIWQIVGLGARVITSIGLHRRADPATAPHIAEQRRRIFYSFYNLERTLAPTLCKPLAIPESDIDIELPTVQPDEFIYRGYPIVQLTYHVITYRRLLGKVMTSLYSVNSPNNLLPEPERLAIIHSLHSELDTWIVGVPPPNTTHPRVGTAQKANHNNWWQIHYNQLLCALYRPSPLYPDTTPETLRALHDASSRCVDLYLDMIQINKTSFHLIQIIALFVSCISLLCCLCECDARMRALASEPNAPAMLVDLGLGRYTGADDPGWAAEIRTRVAQCHNLFDYFGHQLPASARYRDTFFGLSKLLLARYGPLEADHHDAHDAHDTHDVHEHHENSAQQQGLGQVSNDLGLQMLATAAGPVNGVPNPVMAPGAVGGSMGMGVNGVGGGGEKSVPPEDDMAGAWDAMTQLWFDIGDLFGEENEMPALDDGWAGEWGQTESVGWGIN